MGGKVIYVEAPFSWARSIEYFIEALRASLMLAADDFKSSSLCLWTVYLASIRASSVSHG